MVLVTHIMEDLLDVRTLQAVPTISPTTKIGLDLSIKMLEPDLNASQIVQVSSSTYLLIR